MSTTTIATNNYTDLHGLNQIRVQAQTHQDSAIGAVADQFAAVFNQMMLSQMRQANDIFSSDLLGGSNTTKMYQDLYDKELTLSLSQANKGGLAQQIEQQLRGQQQRTSNANLPMALQSYQTVANNGNAVPSTAPALPNPFNTSVVANLQTYAKKGVQAVTAAIKSPSDFVKAVWNDAVAAAKEIGVDPRVLVAQAALETGWGQHMPQQADGTSSNNLFGIKADASWKSQKVMANTLEYKNNVAQQENSAFRVYTSFKDSFSDYASFIRGNPRYQEALQNAQDSHQFVKGLQKAGYATDPSYADKVTALMNTEVLRNGVLD